MSIKKSEAFEIGFNLAVNLLFSGKPRRTVLKMDCFPVEIQELADRLPENPGEMEDYTEVRTMIHEVLDREPEEDIFNHRQCVRCDHSLSPTEPWYWKPRWAEKSIGPLCKPCYVIVRKASEEVEKLL